MRDALLRNMRVTIALVGLLGVFLAPAYVPLACIVLLSLRFRAWEALLIGLLMDLTWLPQLGLHTLPLYTCLALAIVWVLEPLRVQLLR